MIILILRWLAVIAAAFLVGKLVSKLRLPSILGWLITGMFLGPHALNLLPETVQKYLGFTLLPHSGVSLVFTGIAVSVLADAVPECTKIIQGTIAAAAVINEIIAVIAAKKGFEWAGEFSFENKT